MVYVRRITILFGLLAFIAFAQVQPGQRFHQNGVSLVIIGPFTPPAFLGLAGFPAPATGPSTVVVGANADDATNVCFHATLRYETKEGLIQEQTADFCKAETALPADNAAMLFITPGAKKLLKLSIIPHRRDDQVDITL